MDIARVDFVHEYEANENVTSLMNGSPGPETLKHCKDIILKATKHLLDQETDTTPTFCYGPNRGDVDFREELAQFLTQEYRDTVESSKLMVTAGATQALHMIATILFSKDSVVFIEDPTYFNASRVLRDDLQMKLVPVPCDADGMDTDVLERLLSEYHPKEFKGNDRLPFWGMVYMIPVYQNPTGCCYSPSRCRRLVELARKHDVLLLAEDVYNLIHFGDSPPPARLLSYDKPSDPDYSGHVLSNGTFSKFLAPGLRLGWLEAPDRILKVLYDSHMVWSGGSLNHFASKLAGSALKLGLQTEHLHNIRRIYKTRMDAVCRALRDGLPEGATFTEPQGGFYVWIKFPEETDTFEMVKWMTNKYNIFFLPGDYVSTSGKFGHCARISISYYEEEALVNIVHTLCKGATEFIHLHKSAA